MTDPTPAEPSEGATIVWGEELEGLDNGEWECRFASHHDFELVEPDT